MDWFSSIGNILSQYTNHQPGQVSSSAEQDYDQVASAAPKDDMIGGLSAAFRSDQTPPFGSMLGQLFGNSNSSMKASVLNSLIAAVGPQVLSSILARHGGSGLPNQQITAEQADRIPPGAVQEMAAEAQKHDPNIVDQISSVYAEHPALVKTLGAAALGIAINHLAKQKHGLF